MTATVDGTTLSDTVTVTFTTTTADDEMAAANAAREVADFMEERARLITGNRPDIARRLARLRNGTAPATSPSSPPAFAMGGAQGAERMRFSWYAETANSWNGIGADDIAIAVPEVDVGIGELEAGLRLSRTMEDGVSAQYLELDGILELAGDSDRRHRLRMGAGITVPEPWLGGILDLGLRLDGLAGDDWQAYGLKFGYSLEPHWLPGTVDMGLSFDGLGVEDVDFGGLEIGFRPSPGRWWPGGALTTSAGIDADADISAGFSWRGDF